MVSMDLWHGVIVSLGTLQKYNNIFGISSVSKSLIFNVEKVYVEQYINEITHIQIS